MFSPIGLLELVVIVVGLVFWLVPLTAVIWALVTLQRIRASQQLMSPKLESIQHLLDGVRQAG